MLEFGGIKINLLVISEANALVRLQSAPSKIAACLQAGVRPTVGGIQC
ncbi:hypothetical protein [Oceaniovalibus sp. ACAM 378]|nr:hypothetical protein [Oceaniovalibus sp. ACAM 378]